VKLLLASLDENHTFEKVIILETFVKGQGGEQASSSSEVFESVKGL
jgi:hypothetical protein